MINVETEKKKKEEQEQMFKRNRVLKELQPFFIYKITN